MHSAAETVIKLLARADTEGWGLFIVEWAASHVILPGFLELNTFAHNVRDVGAGQKLLDKVLRDPSGHRSMFKESTGPGADIPRGRGLANLFNQ